MNTDLLFETPWWLPAAIVVVGAVQTTIMAIAYLAWRRVSWQAGFLVVAWIHALLNVIPAIWTIAYAT